jgi:hypothetical protein
MSMFKPTKAKTVREYIDSVPEERKEIIVFLHKFIQEAVPKLKPYLTSSMLGYGSFQYRSYKNELGRWPIIALANQKQYVSLYVCAIADGQYIAEKHKKELGRVTVGRSCISFKKLEDLHLPVLKKVLREAEKHPGLVSASPKKK